MKKSIIIYSHLTFWIIVLLSKLLSVFSITYLTANDLKYTTVKFVFFPFIIFYIGYFIIMKLVRHPKSILTALIFFTITILIVFFYAKKTYAYCITILSANLVWFFLGGLLRFFIDWFKKKSSIQTLQKENIESQLALLRMQINPHFLFNTLHNIDALIYKYPERASQSIVKLSDIMRYMLNDSKTEFISIEKELAYLENYITLEKLRLKNQNFLDYTISGDFKNKQIAVMILIPFIENAIKHSVDSEINQGIIIHFSFIQNKLIFTCANKFDVLTIDKDKTHGIGLDTVKKRLSILYANKHNLIITTENSIFKVELEILLDES